MTNKNELQVAQPQQQPLTLKSLFNRDDVKQKFQEMLGKRANQFITSVLQIAASNALLAKADPMSIFNSAAMAATLDLPLNNNLGYAYIIPYNSKQPDGTFKQMAQFQLGYKGFIQLAQRSGQFKTINSTDIREGEIKKIDRLTGEINFDWLGKERDEKKVVGFLAFFRLLNGFEKTLYLSVEEIKRHGAKYSKTFSNARGLWNTDFEAMAHKTVVKLLLARYAPLSIEMQQAVKTDQAIINNEDGTDLTYTDHEEVVIDKEAERIALMIQDCKTVEELDELYPNIKEEQMDLFLQAKEKLSTLNKKGK